MKARGPSVFGQDVDEQKQAWLNCTKKQLDDARGSLMPHRILLSKLQLGCHDHWCPALLACGVVWLLRPLGSLRQQRPLCEH